MRKRKRKTWVMEITNVEHAVDAASATCNSDIAAISGLILKNGIDKGSRCMGKVPGVRYSRQVEITWASYFIGETQIYPLDKFNNEFRVPRCVLKQKIQNICVIIPSFGRREWIGFKNRE